MNKLPEHLFVSGNDLYDSRDGWFTQPPLRTGYYGGARDISIVAQMKATLRDDGCRFGYDLYFTTNNGDIICENCTRSNFRLVCESISKNISDEWKISHGNLTNADDYLPDAGVRCNNCNEWIVEPEE